MSGLCGGVKKSEIPLTMSDKKVRHGFITCVWRYAILEEEFVRHAWEFVVLGLMMWSGRNVQLP